MSEVASFEVALRSSHGEVLTNKLGKDCGICGCFGEKGVIG